MPLPDNTNEISSQVRDELAGSQWECNACTPLSGGNANFVFCGQLARPLPDGTSAILIKHGEGYVSSNPAFKLTTSRCLAEAECLKRLAALPPSSNDWCTVRTPKLHHFDPATNTQVQEYLDASIDLKNYALKHYPPSTPAALEPQCRELGRGLGRWLRSFHEWVVQPEQAALVDIAISNQELKRLKHMTYYEYLVQFIDRFPAVLGDSRGVLEQVKGMADAELEDDSKLQVVHGDFWTGNALLPDKEVEDGSHTPMFIVDWEVSSLGIRARDLGQMMAELYMLKLFKDIDAGAWLIEGYLDGYGAVDPATAFRVAIHVGTHLVVIGGSVAGWGSPEDVDRVVGFGRDMILRGWEKDGAWFRDTPLKGLFTE